MVVPLVGEVVGGRSLPAAGAWWTRRGSGITPGTGEPAGSIMGLVCMAANLPERRTPVAASHRSIEGGSSVAGDDAVREFAARRMAGGAPREVASQKR
jgi:hypothetical protein